MWIRGICFAGHGGSAGEGRLIVPARHPLLAQSVLQPHAAALQHEQHDGQAGELEDGHPAVPLEQGCLAGAARQQQRRERAHPEREHEHQEAEQLQDAVRDPSSLQFFLDAIEDGR